MGLWWYTDRAARRFSPCTEQIRYHCNELIVCEQFWITLLSAFRLLNLLTHW